MKHYICQLLNFCIITTVLLLHHSDYLVSLTLPEIISTTKMTSFAPITLAPPLGSPQLQHLHQLLLVLVVLPPRSMKNFVNTQFARSSARTIRAMQQQRPRLIPEKLASTKMVDSSEGEAERPEEVNANHPVGEWIDQ